MEKDLSNSKTQMTKTKREKFVELVQLLMPLIAVTWTALLGWWIGQGLQDSSFRRNELFKAKLGEIAQSKKDVQDIYEQANEAIRQIHANEDKLRVFIKEGKTPTDQENLRRYYQAHNAMGPSIERLDEAYRKLEVQKAAYNDLFPHDSSDQTLLDKKAALFNNTIDSLRNCLRTNTLSGDGCYATHKQIVEPITDIINAHHTLAEDLIKQYK